MFLMHPGDVLTTYADVSGLIEDFDYKPDTSHTEGIDRFIRWYKSFYANENPSETWH